MNSKSKPSSVEAPMRCNWTEPEEKYLIRLVKKHQKRLEEGEISMGDLFDEVFMEVNGLGTGIQRSTSACDQKWRRICGKKHILRSNK